MLSFLTQTLISAVNDIILFSLFKGNLWYQMKFSRKLEDLVDIIKKYIIRSANFCVRRKSVPATELLYLQAEFYYVIDRQTLKSMFAANTKIKFF